MYRLLVVDDEPHVTDWLVDMFSGLPMPLDIYKAYSAKAALEWLSRSRIDIVVTDINMPKMNGLEMMKIIRSSWPECKVIFLTGHNEFEYAYEAIRHEAAGYVLKTESDREIVACVEKAISQIEESHRVESLLEKSREQFSQALPLILRDLANGLISSGGAGTLPSAARLAELGVTLAAGRPVHLLLGREDKARVSPAGGNELFFRINAVVEMFIGLAFHIFFSPVESGMMLWVLQPKVSGIQPADAAGNPAHVTSEVFLRDVLDTVQDSVRESLGCTVSFSVSDQAVAWSDIPHKFRMLREILDLSQDSEAIATEKSYGKLHLLTDANEPVLNAGAAEKLENYLEKGDKAGLSNLLDVLRTGLDSVRSMSYPPAVEAYYTLSLRFLSYINRRNLAKRIMAEAGLAKLMRAEEHGSWAEAVEYLHRVACSILEAQSIQINDMEKGVVDQVKRYISNHLGEDVSLVRLAEIVHFNPSYLSRFFKQVTGMNLTDYIFNAKVAMAKELLEDNRIKIHEVASAVGFESSTYFAKFFRRITGLNPQEYRDGIGK